MTTFVHVLLKRSAVLSVPFLSAVLITSLVAGVAHAQATKDGWTTSWAKKLGVKLDKTFDSSGPDAWDPKAHPLVFMTSEGPGYGGLLSGVKLPGLAIFDAERKQVVTSQAYDVLSWGWKSVFEPHGLGVSPDGKWIYLSTRKHGPGAWRRVQVAVRASD